MIAPISTETLITIFVEYTGIFYKDRNQYLYTEDGLLSILDSFFLVFF